MMGSFLISGSKSECKPKYQNLQVERISEANFDNLNILHENFTFYVENRCPIFKPKKGSQYLYNWEQAVDICEPHSSRLARKRKVVGDSD